MPGCAKSMKGKKSLALILAALLIAAESNIVKYNPIAKLNIEDAVAPNLDHEDIISRWTLGQTADVNDYVDNTISMLVPFMQNNGLDPMPLPEIVEGFEVRLLLITYSAWLKLQNGNMTGLVNVSRFEDQLVNYFAKMLRVKVQLQFSDLEFDYDYLVKVMNIGPTGRIIGSLDRFRVVADILIDFNNDEIQLQQFSLTDVGRLRVKLRGNVLTDWLVNPVISVFTRLFNSIIMWTVQLTIRNVAQSAISEINAAIRNIVTQLESYN